MFLFFCHYLYHSDDRYLYLLCSKYFYFSFCFKPLVYSMNLELLAGFTFGSKVNGQIVVSEKENLVKYTFFIGNFRLKVSIYEKTFWPSTSLPTLPLHTEVILIELTFWQKATLAKYTVTLELKTESVIIIDTRTRINSNWLNWCLFG